MPKVIPLCWGLYTLTLQDGSSCFWWRDLPAFRQTFWFWMGLKETGLCLKPFKDNCVWLPQNRSGVTWESISQLSWDWHKSSPRTSWGEGGGRLSSAHRDNSTILSAVLINISIEGSIQKRKKCKSWEIKQEKKKKNMSLNPKDLQLHW